VFVMRMKKLYCFNGGCRTVVPSRVDLGENNEDSRRGSSVAVGGSQSLTESGPTSSPLSQDVRDYVAGARIDALDTVRKWYDATIIAVDINTTTRVLVHFERWSNRWDEWIPLFVVGQNAIGSVVNPRLQPLGSMFNRSADALQSDFRFFQVQWKRSLVDQSQRDGRSNSPHDILCPSAAASHGNRFLVGDSPVFVDDDQRKEVERYLDSHWQDEIIPAVFSNNDALLRIIQECRCIVREAQDRDIIAMVETSLISRRALEDLFAPSRYDFRQHDPQHDKQGGRLGEAQRFQVSSSSSDSNASSSAEILSEELDEAAIRTSNGDVHDGCVPQHQPPPILRLVELYNIETVNAFFIVVNWLGDSLIYSRYGARHWKHS
jgi:hypothetical protein